MSTNKQANRLIHEKSPYLLQHAYNPVQWYPWSDEAFQKSKSEDKPIFLSIGYSTCHWCHVMERESFEDEEVADILNKHFVAIKVDREERPDIDHIYMSVCQALTGSGGWPLTVLMTPEAKPFFAGTYFPKYDRMGMSGLINILQRINEIWHTNRKALLESSEKILKAIESPEDELMDSSFDTDEDALSDTILYNQVVEDAFKQYSHSFDSKYGGFGSSPKFPTPHNLLFLLRYWYKTKENFALEMVEKTLVSMHRGGIYDHIGFGFSRYSTDRKWLVPHFEKMLYDNALLSIAYLEAYQITRNNKYADISREIFTYILRDMTSPQGGFYSAEDADSEGEEGKFYLWASGEVKKVLGEKDGEKFCKYYDITAKGNFERKNIPNLISSSVDYDDDTSNTEFTDFIRKYREKLFNYRESRTHPYKDDKILTSWNGLMITALSIGGRILQDKKYIIAAEKAVEFIFDNLIREDGRLLARFRDGDASFPAYVDDYAFLIWGLIELYETTYKPDYLQKALKLNEDLIKFFWDKKNGGLFVYGSDSERLITRPKEIYDGATPSGNSVSALNFFRLAKLTGQYQLEEKGDQLLRAFSSDIQGYPMAYSFSLIAILFSQSSAQEIVIVDPSIYSNNFTASDSQSIDTNDHIDTDDPAYAHNQGSRLNMETGIHINTNTIKMLEIINQDFRPFTVTLLYSKQHEDLKNAAPFVSDYSPVDDKSTAYVCENFSCKAPVTDIEDLLMLVQ